MGVAQAVESAPATEIVRASAIMTVKEAQNLERQHAGQSQYYCVYLKDDRDDSIVRVRTPVYELDEERVPVVDANDRPIARNVHDLALNVWAAYGADEFTLMMVMRGPQCVATPESIANELAMANATTDQG